MENLKREYKMGEIERREPDKEKHIKRNPEKRET